MTFDASKAMTIRLPAELPPEPIFDPQYRRGRIVRANKAGNDQ